VQNYPTPLFWYFLQSLAELSDTIGCYEEFKMEAGDHLGFWLGLCAELLTCSP
jgi:hypothetical protein